MILDKVSEIYLLKNYDDRILLKINNHYKKGIYNDILLFKTSKRTSE